MEVPKSKLNELHKAKAKMEKELLKVVTTKLLMMAVTKRISIIL